MSESETLEVGVGMRPHYLKWIQLCSDAQLTEELSSSIPRSSLAKFRFLGVGPLPPEKIVSFVQHEALRKEGSSILPPTKDSIFRGVSPDTQSFTITFPIKNHRRFPKRSDFTPATIPVVLRSEEFFFFFVDLLLLLPEKVIYPCCNGQEQTIVHGTRGSVSKRHWEDILNC